MEKKVFKKTIVLGASGFIGSSLCKLLKKKKITHLSFNSKNCNLLKRSSFDILKKNINNGDKIILISAIAPCKTIKDLTQNIKMLDSLLKLISDKKISHLIYISSDAVYEDSLKKMTENSSIKPNSLHGIMHCVREDLLKLYFKNNLSIVRPTLVYGPQDTHNGYGPNYFARNALQNRNIHVFGNGEELRDHVYIDDVSQLIFEILNKKKNGIFNAVSANPITFHDLAKKIIKKFKSKSKIIKIPRKGPMPHNGYRCFNNNKLKKIFPNLRQTKINQGISKLEKIKNITT